MSCFERFFGSGKKNNVQSKNGSPTNSPSGDTERDGKDKGVKGQRPSMTLPGGTEELGVENDGSLIDAKRPPMDLELEDIANEFMVTDPGDGLTAATPTNGGGQRTLTPDAKSSADVCNSPPGASSANEASNEGSQNQGVGGMSGDAAGRSRIEQAGGSEFNLDAAASRREDAGARPGSGDVDSGVVVDWIEQDPGTDMSDGVLQSPGPAKIRWKKGELLGVGAFGKVFLGLNLDTGELMAVKVVPVPAAHDGEDEQTEELIREISLSKVLFNEHIVRYIGTERDESHLYIFLEYVPGGSISSVVHKFGKFSESLVSEYTRQILVGLQYLHEHKIMHRDIKGANILVSNNNCVKLADFGASKRITEMLTQHDCKSLRGTPYWMAPEVIMQTGHGRSADIWSVGCTVIEMLTGKPPYSEFPTQVSVLFHIASSEEPPALPPNISEECEDFLRLCLQRNPKDRPTASVLLQHAFVCRSSGSGMDSPGWNTPSSRQGVDSQAGRTSPGGSLLDPRVNAAAANASSPHTGSVPSSPATGKPPKAPRAGGAPEEMAPLPAASMQMEGEAAVKKSHHAGFGAHARFVRDTGGDHMADEKVVRDYLREQVRENDKKLPPDFRDSLKLLTKTKKPHRNRNGLPSRSGASPSPSPQISSPANMVRATPDYGVLSGGGSAQALPPSASTAEVGGVALGEAPISSTYAAAMARSSAEASSEASVEARLRASKAEKDRLWQEELERERLLQAALTEEKLRNGAGA